MSLIVEDGTGLENANAFIDVAFADDYFGLRATGEWNGTEAEKEARIIRATDYINLRFERLVKGKKKNEDQSLLFPFEEHEELPTQLKNACAEYALRAVNQLMPDPVYDNSGKVVISKSEKTGPLAESVTYRDSNRTMTFRKYPVPDMMMLPFLISYTGSRVIR